MGESGFGNYGNFDDYDNYDENENDDDNFGLIPHPSSLDFHTGFDNNALSSHIEFQGKSPYDFAIHSDPGSITASASSASGSGHRLNADLPSLVPNEDAGSCHRYTGSVCKEFINNEYIFVSEGVTQDHAESMLQQTLKVIMRSSKLSKECGKYAASAICHSTLPLCDMNTQPHRPRKVRMLF